MKINNNTIFKNITNDSISYIIFELFKNHNIILHILKNNNEITIIEKQINFYNPEIKILKFLEWNTIPYDINSPKIEIQSNRMKFLYDLINFDNLYKNQKILILTTINSLIQKVVNKNDYKFIELSKNQKITTEELKIILDENGFKKTQISQKIGDYSINGNTIDLISYNDIAYRIYLQNNIIKNIKNFYIETQITYQEHNKILLLPNSEIIFSQKNINNFKQNYKNIFGIERDNDLYYKNISNSIPYDGMENYLPLFYENKLMSIFDYLPENTIISYIPFEYNKNIDIYYQLRKIENKEFIYNPLDKNQLYLTEDKFKKKMEKYINVIFDLKNETKIPNYETTDLNIKKVKYFYNETKEVFKEFKKMIKDYL